MPFPFVFWCVFWYSTTRQFTIVKLLEYSCHKGQTGQQGQRVKLSLTTAMS